MALHALMLRKKIDEKKKALEALRAKDVDFEKREAELEQAIGEASADEEQAAVEEEIKKYESEKAEHEASVKDLETQVRDVEAELEKEEAADEQKEPDPGTNNEREEHKTMEIRDKFFGMNLQERTAFFEDQEVQNFLGEVRSCIKEKRALANAGLTIPTVMLPLLKQVVQQTSKLISRVYMKHVAGKSRQVVMGAIPEAVWTEMCATLNELSLGFNDVEVDGYKVGGYFAVCNALLEDNDANLATELIEALGKSIGKAIDKAIIYGTGTKMPQGIVTRLAQTAAPADYSATERAWVDLHSSNVITGTGATEIALFREIIGNTEVARNDYYENGMTFVMNKSTHMKLVMASMGKNSNAAIVAGISQNQMPIVSGDIVELPFIPDDNIVFGYFDAYLLAERADTQIATSEHAKFIEDRTVFKGTARYDGKPVIAEAFGVMSISTTAPATTATFPTDSANP